MRGEVSGLPHIATTNFCMPAIHGNIPHVCVGRRWVDWATSTAMHVENFMTGTKITFTFKKAQKVDIYVHQSMGCKRLNIIRSFFTVATCKL